MPETWPFFTTPALVMPVTVTSAGHSDGIRDGFLEGGRGGGLSGEPEHWERSLAAHKDHRRRQA